MDNELREYVVVKIIDFSIVVTMCLIVIVVMGRMVLH